MRATQLEAPAQGAYVRDVSALIASGIVPPLDVVVAVSNSLLSLGWEARCMRFTQRPGTQTRELEVTYTMWLDEHVTPVHADTQGSPAYHQNIMSCGVKILLHRELGRKDRASQADDRCVAVGGPNTRTLAVWLSTRDSQHAHPTARNKLLPV